MTANVFFRYSKPPVTRKCGLTAQVSVIATEVAVRRKQPFCAFPPTAVRRLRLLQWLPCSVADAVVARLLRRYS